MPIENASLILKKMSHAAMRAGRCPSEVKLVAVTKTVGAEAVKKAVDAGLRCFGENRVQEAQKKISDLISEISNSRIEWHLIGHLQKNKAKYAVQLFDVIQTVDSAALAEELNRQAEKAGKIQRILIQVKLSEEEAKHGVSEKELMSLLEEIKGLHNLKLEGLMTMPPYFEDAEKARPYFKRLREIRDEAGREGYSLPELSMGMSGDFEVAIEEGATMVRIGTAIFGERK
ncbi:MAG: YggS family pyridoxal phosphate-dependent enzyme [Nitrospirae bacterium]|nr:YggS family pyridoxal phosphate-dependent enzyme [Nitrospirota bacterium]MCL5978322.1 YggS family pyridoxal phosphate-dependent enzyme [Nitrospirota bacterium]